MILCSSRFSLDKQVARLIIWKENGWYFGMSAFLPYRIAAAFADGSRLLFDGLNESTARAAMEAAQAVHGDITWWDAVTDENYVRGRYYKTLPATPEIAIIDFT